MVFIGWGKESTTHSVQCVRVEKERFCWPSGVECGLALHCKVLVLVVDHFGFADHVGFGYVRLKKGMLEGGGWESGKARWRDGLGIGTDVID